MTPEIIIAVLSAPLVAGLPTFYLKFREQRRAHKTEDRTTMLSRLEQENVRLLERNQEHRKRIEELEHQEDNLRGALNACKETCSQYRRQLIELGYEVT